LLKLSSLWFSTDFGFNCSLILSVAADLIFVIEKKVIKGLTDYSTWFLFTSVAEPHHFYAAPAPGENFDAAPVPTLLFSKAKILK
jgi:hypothetical protein